jgi:hypothetical protein
MLAREAETHVLYGAAQAAFTQFPVQTVAILTATRTSVR